MTNEQLSKDALAIWKAGVEAVRPQNLIAQHFAVEGQALVVRGTSMDLSSARRLVIVGGGKAAADMATAFESKIIPAIHQALPELEVVGLLSSPELTAAQRQQRDALASTGPLLLEVVEARPMGLNAPTELAVMTTQRILQLVSECDPNDAVLCLLSGGGSALLTAPPPGVSLSDKQHVARLLASQGASIEQLNTVRRSISLIKGGGLARACKANQMVTAILSDVLGDSLETIASGPTVVDANCSSSDALDVLTELGLQTHPDLGNVVKYLKASETSLAHKAFDSPNHVILGNNADATRAAQAMALQLGYACPDFAVTSAVACEPDVSEVATSLLARIRKLQRSGEKTCLISGGEPTVQLPATPGRGGRNQQLALLVLAGLMSEATPLADQETLFLSGGTDGEDGPTDAAGAWFDTSALSKAEAILGIEALHDHAARADAYPVFEQLGTLIQTGITGTNVCDVRVALSCPS